MKRITSLLTFTFLFFAACNPCLAMMEIMHVSRERAKELGMEIRFTGNGPNEVWVELEFKAEGKLKDFDHVSLEIREKDKLLVGYAPLREKRPSPGHVVVHFLASRAYLDKITLSVVTGFPMNMTGHELRVKDFVEAPPQVKRTLGGQTTLFPDETIAAGVKATIGVLESCHYASDATVKYSTADLKAAQGGDHVRLVFPKPMRIMVLGNKHEVSEVVYAAGVFWLRCGDEVVRAAKYEPEKWESFRAWFQQTLPPN